MKFVTGMLGIITSMINILILIIICFNVKLNKNIDGYKLWVLANACNGVGVLLLIMREVISSSFITVIIGNQLIVLGVIFLYIGIMRFIEKNLNYTMIALSYAVFTILYGYLTYVNDNITLRTIAFSFFVTVYLIQAGLIILRNKNYSIKAATNFLGGVLLTQGFFFAIRGVITMTSISSNNLVVRPILDISTFIISIIMSPLISFGLILMVNKKLSVEISVAKERYRVLAENIKDVIWVIDVETLRYIYVSPSVYNLSGYTTEEIMSHPIDVDFTSEEKEYVKKLISQRALECISGKQSSFKDYIDENEQPCKDGTTVWTETITTYYVNKETGCVEIRGVTRDISKRKIVEQRLKQSEEKYRLLIENALESIIVVQDEKLKFCNPMSSILTGYSQDELSSISFVEFIYPSDRELVVSNHLKILKGEITETRYQYRVLRKDSHIRWVEMNSVLIKWDGEAATLNFQTDITQRKKSEEEILYLSYHDQLTGLYNRRFYEEELKRLDIERNLPLTLIIGDVNGLKLINDAFGHLAGDKLIKEIAAILKKECRDDEILARIGGDEFIILLPKTDSEEAQKIVQRINISIGNKKLDNMVLSISFGWGTKYEVNKEITKTYMKAEDHMYRNKLFESNSMKSKTIEIITRALYEKNEIEQHHCERVSELCTNMGVALGLSPDEVNGLKMAGLLHDIGKIGIDEKILNKPGRLNENEWVEVKRHPEIGYQILRFSNEFSHIAEFILAHHERWDGKGYPKELKGDEIPFVSRIITIADAYDEMTSKRSYRSSLSKEVALEELQKNAGTQFDPELVSRFIEKVLGKSV